MFAAAGAEAYAELRPLVRSDTLTVTATGALALHHDFTDSTRLDVQRAELVILPVVPVLLLLVFGSVVAAALPFAVGLMAVVGGLAGTLLLTRVTSVSVYATNVVTMIGLAVAIDYSLFIVSRYREEIRRRPASEALACTPATAGRSILFSGLTVAIGPRPLRARPRNLGPSTPAAPSSSLSFWTPPSFAHSWCSATMRLVGRWTWWAPAPLVRWRARVAGRLVGP